MKRTRERKFMLKQFKSISRAISTYEDMNLLLNHLAEGVSRAFSIAGASILLYDENSKQFDRVASYGLSEEYNGDRHIDANAQCRNCVGNIIEFINVRDEKCVNHMNEASKAGINFILSIPVKFRQTSVGVLRLYHTESVSLHNEDVDALEILTCQLGMAIELNGLKNVVSGVKMSLDTLPDHTLEAIKSVR